jgi:pimeloyl-ACP methyl ester carboxylesterase
MAGMARTAEHAEGRYIEINGATLHYEQRGTGAPLVLIHGGLVSSAMWAPLLPDLVDDFRVITPDNRGHGRSTNPSGRLSYAQMADDVAALIAALGLDRPVVGGYSDGGLVTLTLGVRHPGVAGALIVAAAHPYFEHSVREYSRAFLGADDAGTPDVAHVEAKFGDEAEIVKSWHQGGEEQWRAIVQHTAPMWLDYEGPTADDVRSIDVPVLVLAGDRDKEWGRLDLMVQLYKALPDGELGVCPRANHVGLLTPERTGIVAAMIEDFARRRGSPRCAELRSGR